MDRGYLKIESNSHYSLITIIELVIYQCIDFK